MSQNDPPNNPAGFDRDFLSSDVDLQIAHPSPGAEIYTRSSSFSLPSGRLITALVVMTATALGGTYYYAYQQGLAEGQRSLPPVVLAENTPIKVAPEDVPGGVAEKPQDLNIYGVMRGERAQSPTASTRSGSPADNAPGTIESLIAQTEDPFGGVLDEPSADETLPPGNSITVLRERDDVKVDPPRPDLNRAPRAKPVTQAAPVAKPAPPPVAKPAPKAVPKPVTRSAVRQDYMVQLAASRSRALARGVYSNLQKNYNDLLGRRDPLILRVDLGDRGIFYRVNVPGFASRNAATAFCANLKKRGQDCLVRKQN